MYNDFYLSVDEDGKMPQMTRDKPTKEYYVRYVDNRPVEIKPYPGQDTVWDYASSKMLGLGNSVMGGQGRILQPYRGKIL